MRIVYVVLALTVAMWILGTSRRLEDVGALRSAPASQYTNLCITERPYGSSGSVAPLKYWADRPKSWATEYSDARLATDSKTLRDYAPDMPHAPAHVRSSVEDNYYHNPAEYCRAHPDRYPCPNSWV